MTGDMVVERKHSGFGIASFVVGVITAVMMFALFAVAAMMETSTPGGMDEESIGAMLVGLALFALLGLDLLAMGLGIAGLLHAGRRKVFAILGLCVCVATVLGTLFLLLLGLAAG